MVTLKTRGYNPKMTGNWWWWQVKTISELPRFSATAGNMNPTFSQHGHRGSHRIPGSARTWKKLNDLTWAIFALTFSPGRGVFKKIQWKGHWCSRNPWFLPIAFWENWPAKDDLLPAIYPKAWASFQSLIIVSGNGVSSATYLHVLGFFLPSTRNETLLECNHNPCGFKRYFLFLFGCFGHQPR